MLLGEFAVVSHLRIFSLELLDQPRSQWPAQVALREKLWDDTHFKLVAVNTTVSYYLWDDTTTSSHICPNSIICPHHGNNTMYLNGQGRPHTWPVFSNRLRDLYFPTCSGDSQCLRSKKKCILVLRQNFGSKQVVSTPTHFSKLINKEWRKFFFFHFLP